MQAAVAVAVAVSIGVVGAAIAEQGCVVVVAV
jgi:hypothetical protein